MFDIGWSELLVIAVVAIVVVGPKDLPKLMRGFGHYAGKLRRAASDFQRQFEEAMRESEVEEVRKAIESVKAERLDLKAPIDQPVMLPKPATASAAETPAKPKPPAKPAAKPRKRAAAKAKSPAKSGKTKTERAP
jgi:sec-independent protein translocase protein TatB